MRTRLLTQNREMAKDNIWNWTLPAFGVRLPDGRTMNVCPNAGACATVCYALNGSYLFPDVKAAHMNNLMWSLDKRDTWQQVMVNELRSKRFRPTGKPRAVPGLPPARSPFVAWWLANGGAAVRVHDSGDFYDDGYLTAWLEIIAAIPDVLFYAYTKQVEQFQRMVVGQAPANFKWVFSLGGRQDHMLTPGQHRVAEVFAAQDDIAAAGYTDQSGSDLLAVLHPSNLIGIPANNIPHYRKRMEGRTFSTMQTDRKRRPA